MALLNRMQATATRLIGQYGETATLVRKGAVVDENAYPKTYTPDTPFTFQVVPSKPSFSDTTAGNTQTGDIMLTLALGDTDPTTDDKIIMAGLRYSVEGVERVALQGGTVVWKVMVRGGVPVSSG